MRFRFADFELDEESRELFRDGRAVRIEPKAFRLLRYLLEQRDRTVTKEELHAELWPDEHVGPSSLTYCVRAARRAVGDGRGTQAVIRTVHGSGYRFAAPVEELRPGRWTERPAETSPTAVLLAVRLATARLPEGEEGEILAGRWRQAIQEAAERAAAIDCGTASDCWLMEVADARRALSLAAEMRKEGAPVAIAVHAAGARRGAAPAAEAVETAAAMATKAEPGRVLVSRAVRDAGRDLPGQRFVDLSTRRLPASRRRLRLYEVLPVAAGPAEALTQSLSRKPPLVGRAAPLRLLRDLLARIGEREGACVLLAGEPGIGKTRLAEEVLVTARGIGLTVLGGACYEVRGAPAYAPFVEALTTLIERTPPARLSGLLGDDGPWLARLLPALARQLGGEREAISVGPEQERHLILGAAVSFLSRAARRSPIVLFLEDLHWADHSTALLLAYLARSLNGVPLLVLATYRDEEIGDTHPLAPVMAELTRMRWCHFVPLEGLDVAGARELIATLAGEEPPHAIARAVCEESEGNPLFIQELLKILSSEGRLFDAAGQWRSEVELSGRDLPRTIRMVIERRLALLDPMSLRAMRSATAIGRSWRWDVLQDVSRIDVEDLLDAVDAAEQTRLIEGRREGRAVVYSFTHELIAQQLYASINLARRQHLHARIADVLEARYGDDAAAHAPELAHHFRAAGVAVDAGRARRYLLWAGDAAMSSSAFEEAAEWYRDAAELSAEGSAERAGLLFRIGDAYQRADRRDMAVEYFQQAVRAYETLDDRGGLEEVYLALTSLHGWQGQFGEMLVALQSGLAAAPASQSRARCLLQSVAGKWLVFGREPVAAERAVQEALQIAERLQDASLLGNVLATRGGNEWIYTDFAAAAATLAEAAESLRSVNDMNGYTLCLMDRVIALGYLGRFPEMEQHLNDLGPLVERYGDPGRRAAHRLARGVLAYARGQLGEAHRCASAAEAVARSGATIVLPSILVLLGDVELCLGHWQRVERLYGEAHQVNEAMGAPPARYVGPLTRLWLYAFWEEIEEAETLLSELPAPPAAGELVACDQLDAMLTAAEALVMLDDERARDYYAPLVRMAERAVFGSVTYPLVQRVLGMIAIVGEDHHAAAAHLSHALRQADSLGARKERALVFYWAAELAQRRGEAGGCREQALRAAEELEELGMPRHRDRALALQAD